MSRRFVNLLRLWTMVAMFQFKDQIPYSLWLLISEREGRSPQENYRTGKETWCKTSCRVGNRAVERNTKCYEAHGSGRRWGFGSTEKVGGHTQNVEGKGRGIWRFRSIKSSPNYDGMQK